MKLRRARTGLSVYPGLTPLFFWSGKFSCRFLLRLSLHSCSLCPFSPLPLSHPPSLHTTLSNFRSHSRHFSQFQLARWGDRLPQYNLIKSDQIWSNLVKTIILIRFDQFWSDLIRFDQILQGSLLPKYQTEIFVQIWSNLVLKSQSLEGSNDTSS